MKTMGELSKMKRQRVEVKFCFRCQPPEHLKKVVPEDGEWYEYCPVCGTTHYGFEDVKDDDKINL